jgi:hypothetical protein
MNLERKHLCPLLKKKCIQLDCEWFVQIAGTDPQDQNKQIEEWGCAVVFTLLGQLEVAKRTTGGFDGLQQATESFRNQTVRASEMNLAALVTLAQSMRPDVELRTLPARPSERMIGSAANHHRE